MLNYLAKIVKLKLKTAIKARISRNKQKTLIFNSLRRERRNAQNRNSKRAYLKIITQTSDIFASTCIQKRDNICSFSEFERFRFTKFSNWAIID